MAIKRTYRRRMIMLQESDSDYRIDAGKKLTGYAKIGIRGTKGTLTTYVQNLKYSENGEWIYKGFVARASRDPQLINTGTIIIDKKGKGEGIWKFDAGNVEGVGSDIYEFDIVGVMVYRGNGTEQNAKLLLSSCRVYRR